MEQLYRCETYLGHDTKPAQLNTRKIAPEATPSDGRQSYGETAHLFMVVQSVLSKLKGPIRALSVSDDNAFKLEGWDSNMSERTPMVVDTS